MCFGRKKKSRPKPLPPPPVYIPTPAPAPAPPPPPAPTPILAPQVEPRERTQGVKRKGSTRRRSAVQRGTSQLSIPLNTGQKQSGGLNV